MALKKTVTTEHGASAEYHKIVSIRDMRTVPEVTVFVNVYKDANCKTLVPMIKKAFVFNNIEVEVSENVTEIPRPYFLDVDDVNPEGQNHIKLAYEALKLLQDYSGAEDV